MDPASWSLTARWIFPVASAPLPNGVVRIHGERIVAVEPETGRADLDLGNAAVLPGLVNAHTHLDLSGMHGLAPPTPDFTDWLRQVIAHRRKRTPEQVQADIRAGLDQCIRTGTTLVGDISGDGASWDALASSGICAIVFRELLGLTADRAEQALNGARAWLEAHPTLPTCRPALSPHAPYSVRTSLFGSAAVLARQFRVPLAVHVAETLDELSLLHQRRGPFVPFLKELGVWDPDGLADSVTAVLRICDTHIAKLFVHGNHLAPSVRIPRNSTIVYCPRTHAAFGHPPHPYRQFLARGVRVALGTDSLASNPDLDLLAEVRFLHRRDPDLPGPTLLQLATLAGAEALGWADMTGSLEAGKSADLIVLPLPEQATYDPHDLILGTDLAITHVLCRGRWLLGP